jgi:hypothetical protein
LPPRVAGSGKIVHEQHSDILIILQSSDLISDLTSYGQTLGTRRKHKSALRHSRIPDAIENVV